MKEFHSELIVYCDCSCRNDSTGKTPRGIGIYAIRKINGVATELARESFYLDELGNSYNGEVMAVKYAVKEAIKHYSANDRVVIIRGDNQTSIKQYNKEYGINDPKMREEIEWVRKLIKSMFDCPVRFEWVKRDFNKEADELSKQARQEYLDTIGFDYN